MFRVSEVHLLDDRYYRVVVRLERPPIQPRTDSTLRAEFDLLVHAGRRRGSKKHVEKTIDQMSKEAKEEIRRFCEHLLGAH